MCRFRFVVHTAALVVLIGLVGCGDGRPTIVPIKGTVTLNGQPAEGVLLGFEPQGISGYQRPSVATSDSQGQFTVNTYGNGDGLPAGKFIVTAFKRELVGKPPEGFNSEDTAANATPVKYQWTVPRKYSTAVDSGLTVEVTSSGMTPATIELVGEPEAENSSSAAGAP